MTDSRRLPARLRTPIRRRTRRALVATTAVLALVVGGTDVFLLTQARRSTAVDLDSALAEFREQTGADAVDGAPTDAPDSPITESTPEVAETTDPTAPDATTEQPVVTESDPAPQPTSEQTAPPAGQPAPPAPSAQPTQPAKQATVRMPAQGVYEYITDGYETVSFGNGRHDYPQRTYASVRHDGGCDYTVEHRWVEEHVERQHRCNQGSDVLGKWSDAEVTFFGQTETSQIRCEPPVVIFRLGDAKETTREFTCNGSDTNYVETVRFLGDERMVVGGVEVMAKHVLATGKMSGRSQGTSYHERWLHPEDGTVLKGIRRIDTQSQAFGTTVRYVENVTYTLASLTPRR